jgi:tetratricopeptide (TPR) repeat protein
MMDGNGPSLNEANVPAKYPRLKSVKRQEPHAMRTAFPACIIATAMLSLVAVGGCRDNACAAKKATPQTWEAWEDQAEKAMIDGRTDMAIDGFTEVILLKPDYANAYYNRGNAYLELGYVDHAIADDTEFIRLRPDSPHGYAARAEAHKKKGDNAKAELDSAKTHR